MIEDAILNDRTATAHLVKTWHYSINVVSTPTLQQIYKTYPYEGKYTYSYNGKKYTKKFKFMSNPPSSIRIFFNKNPKDII